MKDAIKNLLESFPDDTRVKDLPETATGALLLSAMLERKEGISAGSVNVNAVARLSF